SVMLLMFPNAAPSDPDAFVQMLIEHVIAIGDVGEPALEGACIEFVETQKFVDVSNLLPILDKSADDWHARRYAFDRVEDVRAKAFKARAEYEQWEKQRDRENAKKKRDEGIQALRERIESAVGSTQRCAELIDEAKAKFAAE